MNFQSYRLLPAVLLLSSLPSLDAQTPLLEIKEADVRFSFSASQFIGEIPITYATAGIAQLSVDLVDTRDTVRSHGTGTCALHSGTTVCTVVLPPAHPENLSTLSDNVALFRVRYTVDTTSQPRVTGILALDHIAPTLYVLHAAAPSQVRPGSPYSVRILATHPLTRAAQPNVTLEATVTAELAGKDEDRIVVHRRLTTNRAGFATLDFTTPSDANLDSVNVSIEGHLTNLDSAIEETIKSVNQKSLTLTTDKPLYQPGQTVHLRVLAIDRRGQTQSKAKLKFDVRDPDSTLVFRTEATTSRFGIASVDWQIPARLRFGNYEVQVLHSNDTEDDSDAADKSSARSNIHISRYDLPTFTVAPKPDKPFYLPGQNAAVEVRALYLFGKPVVHGHVRVVRETDRTWNYEKQKYDTTEGAVYQGDLGKGGSYTAHVDLLADEKEYRGKDFPYDANSFEDLHLAAYLTDASTGRTEQRRFDLRITHQPLHVHIIRDALYPKGLPIGFTVAVNTADGLPAPNAAVRIALLPRTSYDPKETVALRAAHALRLAEVRTNSYGIARVDGLPLHAELLLRMPPPVLPLKPDTSDDEEPPQPKLLATARTPDGRTGASMEEFDAPSAIFRLTTDHALYKPGDPIRITITSAEPSLPMNVQLLRNTQSGPLTLATENVTLQNGRATLTFSSGPPDKPDARFAGYITIAAVSLGHDQTTHTRWGYDNTTEPTAFRTILFPRDSALHVAVKLQHNTYRPGDTANANIEVKGPQDTDGEDNSAARVALGLVVVDQAVSERNRSDNDFGNRDSFFFPWRSSYYSSNVVAGLTLADIEQRDPATPFNPELDLAASVLLNGSRDILKLTDNAPDRNVANVFSGILNQRIGNVRMALENYLKTHTELPTTVPALDEILAPESLSISGLRDPWDKPFRLTPFISYGQFYLQLSTNGPDRLPDTDDDFNVNLAEWNWFARHEADLRRVLINHYQRTGTFIRDLPTLTSSLKAEGIDITTWRDAWGEPLTYAFAVEQTNYTITVTSPGMPNATDRARRKPFEAGKAAINWFNDQQFLVQNALTSYAESHPFPTTETDFNTAIRRFGIPASRLVDPWGHALVPTFHSRSIYTDSIAVRARAQADGTLQKRTTITPVTAVIDTVELISLGPDGKRGKPSPDRDPDDFVGASFSHIRSEQSAKQASPQITSTGPATSGPPAIDTGALTGSITDPSGASIPSAAIVATNDATSAEFETHADFEGTFVLDSLPAGLYTIRVTSPGFSTTVIDQVHLLSPDTTLLNITLRVGTVNETVEVTSGSVSLSTESASIAGVGGRAVGVLGGVRFDRLESFAKIFPGAVAPPPPPPPPSNGSATPRVREYFPETLLWRPEVLTDDNGYASIRFPVADTITSWQLSVAASTLRGNTGAGAAGFSTFMPFFAAFDPPHVLTVGDRLTLPITLRNYLDKPVTVRSNLAPVPWLRIDTPPSTVTVGAQESASPATRITALVPITDGKLLFTARPEAATGDSIERPMNVHPNGLETAVTTAGIVSGPTTFDLTIPAGALPGSTDATLKLYPNLAAHLRDALVAMAVYPDGCAEQITSIAWPSLLLQRYAAKLPTPDKAVQTQTRLRLEAAYANLLSNRDSNGGFKYWISSREPDLALTAYVIQFLTAAKPFIAVDEGVIKSAVEYLAKHQSTNGLWIAVDYDGKSRTKDQDGNAMLTASISAMLAGTPGADPLIGKALTATQPFADSIDEPYTLANYALAAISVKDTTRSTSAIARLRSMALTENGGAYWSLETNTPFFGWGRAGRVEATSAALQALLAAGATSRDDLVTRGLLFLDHQQDRHSLWYSTQATARALDVLAAIALSGDASTTAHTKPAGLTVRVDGASVATVALPSADKDAGPLFIPLGTSLTPGAHKVTLDLPAGTPGATAQIVANLYTPWPTAAPASSTTNKEQLRLAVHFDATDKGPATPIHATAHIERLGFRGYGMLIAEIGLPPGADVDRASLETAVANSGYALNHYEILPDKLLLYLWPEAGGYDLHFTFTLRYAIDALTAPSAVYDYYNPDARFDLPPQRFSSRSFPHVQ